MWFLWVGASTVASPTSYPRKPKVRPLPKASTANTTYVNPMKTRFVFHQIVSEEFLRCFPLSQIYARLPVCPWILPGCNGSKRCYESGSCESLICNTRKYIKQQCIPYYPVIFQRVNNTFSILELKFEWLTGIGQIWRGMWASLISSINLQNKPKWHWKHSLATELFEFLKAFRVSLNLSV